MMKHSANNGANKMKKVLFILPALIATLSRKVTKLNKRAAKLGLTPVSLTVNRDSMITICKPNGDTIRKIRVDIEGAPVVLRSWEYLGSIRALSNGEVMLSHDAPEAYRATPRKCDHCNTNRRRSVTVALRNVDTGETVQVGRSCLADYLDDSDAVALADWLEKVNEISEDASGSDYLPSGGCGKRPEPETLSWLAMVGAVIREDGCYRNEGGTKGTAFRDYYGLPLSSYEIKAGETRTEVKPCDLEAAREVLSWVRNLDANNGYLRNLKASLAGDLIDHRAIGVATSAFPALARAKQTEAEREAKEAARKANKERNTGSTHFGEIKRRETFTLTVVGCHHFETDWGYKTAVRMLDADGNLAVWFASGARNYKLGEAFEVKATPKKHDKDRDGNEQTVLTRCSFPEEAELYEPEEVYQD